MNGVMHDTDHIHFWVQVAFGLLDSCLRLFANIFPRSSVTMLLLQCTKISS